MIVPYIDRFGRIAYRDSEGGDTNPRNRNTVPFTQAPSPPPLPAPATTQTPGTTYGPDEGPNDVGGGGGVQSGDSAPSNHADRQSKDGTALGAVKEVVGLMSKATSLPGIADAVVEGLTERSIIDRVMDYVNQDDPGPGAGANPGNPSATAGNPAPGTNPSMDNPGMSESDMSGDHGTPGEGTPGSDPSGMYATGGLIDRPGPVEGPGGPTEDKIKARLSDGEYVIKASVVKLLGKKFFDRLNNLDKTGLMAPSPDTFADSEDPGNELPEYEDIPFDTELGVGEEPPLEMDQPTVMLADGGMPNEGLQPDEGNYSGNQSLVQREQPVARKQTFKEAFRAARKGKQSTFMWNGKKYTSETKEEQTNRRMKAAQPPVSAADEGLYAHGGMVRPAGNPSMMNRPKYNPQAMEPKKDNSLRPKKFSMEFH